MPGLKRHQSASVPPEPYRGARQQRQGSTAPTAGAGGRPSFQLARDVERVIEEEEEHEAASTAARNTTNTQAEDDDAIPLNEKTVLAITAFNGKIGCSYYNPYQRKLFLIEDSLDSSKYDFAINIIDQVKPHLTLVAERADDVLKEAIQAKLSQEIGDFTPVLEVRNGREFSASQGKAYLLDLPILNENNSDDENNPYDEDMQDQDDDVINVGQEGLRNAYNFMRLRNKKKPRSQAATFLNTLKLGRCLTLESEKSLETVGCLLSYLNKRMNAEGELAGMSESVDIIGIEMINLQKTMLINHDALHSLQIFEDESHANVHQKNKKEGLSLYGLLCKTRSPMGKAMLKRWLQQPSLEIPVLEARFDAVDCLSRVENIHISGSLQKIMNVKNVGRALKALQQNQNPVQQWQAIEGFLRACIVIRELIVELAGGKEVEVLQKLCDSFDPALLKELIHEIEDKIDWERSKENHRMCIREGVDEKLDNNRRSYNGLPSLLSRVAAAITEEIDPDFCTSLNVVYFPQLGYLLAVPLAEIAPEEYEEIHGENDDHMAAGMMGGKAPPQGWQFQFSTEISVYYKNSKMRDLDRDIGDLHGFIVDREVELMQQLMVKVLEMEVTLTSVGEVIAELDCLLAFADATRQFEWTRPRVVESNAVRINEGRHPLVELCVDHFVKNDAQFVGGRGISPARLEEIQSKPDKRAILAAEKRHRLAKARKAGESTADIEAEYAGKEHKMGEEGDEEEYSDLLSPDDSILILTGANASGKSVFLKTVAIIVYMAHIGCFVPAGEAIIGLTDKIMTRVSTRESVSRGTSAFMIDLQQVSFMLRNCTARSLLLVDEFGKGTSATDGAGLFVGLIKHLVTLGKDLPKCLLATHFHEIFFNSFLKSQLPIGLAHMELIVDREVGPEGPAKINGARDDDKVVGVTPLFRLAPGLCLRSYAYHCAASFGIGAAIIERAMYVSQCLMEYELLEILDTTITPEEEERIKQSEDIVRRALTIEWDDEDGGDEDDNGHYDQQGDYTMRKLAEILGEKYEGHGGH